MNSNELGTIMGSGKYRRVELKRVVKAPIQRVWSAITNADEVKQWWDAGEIDPREGGRFALGPAEESCGDGLPLDGTIKVFEPPHILEFTWNEAYDPAKGLVRFELVEMDGDTTQIILVETVPATDACSAAAGWHQIAESLGNYLVGSEPVQDNDARYQELQALYKGVVG